MPTFHVTHRDSGAALFAAECPTLRACVEQAVRQEVKLRAANLVGANLARADLAAGGFERADLAGASLPGANLSCADLTAARLAGADLTGASLFGACLVGADLVGAKLRRTNIRRAYLVRANLARADLTGASLADATLVQANLAGALLRNTDFNGADLRHAIFQGASLPGGCTAAGGPVRRAMRSDACEFLLWPTDRGWRVSAGRKFFSLDEARTHWERTRGGAALGEESLDILTFFARFAERQPACGRS